MRRPSFRVFASCASVCAALALEGCASSPSNTRWSRHFEGGVQGGALAAQYQQPVSLVPEAFLLGTIPLSFAYDDQIQKHEENRSLDSSTKSVASILQVVLPAIPVTLGIVQWGQGDGGRKFEVVAESLAGVVFAQQLIASAVGRERPNGRDNKSFPSGHTSWAFASTTLIVRELHEPGDNSFHFTDALLYAPAVFSAWERIASNHHWSSDVTCGALLGVLFTNWVWDAHYGSESENRPTIYEDRRSRGLAWRPTFDVLDGELVVGISAGF
ncbi:MAG: phosphatase PAP2 family protein [Planctomycetes bacterium]|nr:phosphatase PAP2 family protein [Planctomycetota bacterium]